MSGFVRTVAPALLAVFCAAGVSAQLAFEVASIRRSDSLHDGGTMGPKPGRFFATNVPARAFVTFAYNVRGYQLVGGPDWMQTDRYDLEATTGGAAGPDQLREMMKSLLAERFRFRGHFETRELAGYALVRVRPDRLGPSIQPTSLNCQAPPAAPPPAGARFSCGFTYNAGSLTAGAIEPQALADILGGQAGRFALDRTGLTGRFDVELKWAPDAGSPDLPSIFTAVQEQLGLRLEPAQVPTSVLVVDHIERPSDN